MSRYTTAFKEWYREFTEWRRTRPFAGAVLLILGGMIVGYVPMQLLVDVTLLSGSFSFIGLVFAILISLSGVFVLLRPEHSTFFGVAGVLLSTASILVALGGLFVGMTVGTVGGVLCFAWRPPSEDETAEGPRTDGSRTNSLGSRLRRNPGNALLVVGIGLLLLYFLWPVLPTTIQTAPAAEGYTFNGCNPSTGTQILLPCQNPPVEQGIGGVSLRIGDFSTNGITQNTRYVETSTVERNAQGEGIAVGRIEIDNPDYTNGLSARKNFETPGGQKYSLLLKSSSGTINGGADNAITVDMSELYGEQITGTVLGIPLDFNNEITCEPRNSGTLSLGDGLSAQVDVTNLIINAHYIQASQWTLNDFELTLSPGTKRRETPANLETVDNCPGNHPRGTN